MTGPAAPRPDTSADVGPGIATNTPTTVPTTAATGTEEPLVRCVDVARTYGAGPAAVVAVHGTSLEVHPGDRIAITGPSGSGKSTLLHLLAGLEPPTAGVVTWRDGSTGRPAHDIGVIFQGPSLIPALNVAENTALPLLLAGLDDVDAGVLAHEALAAVGVDALADKLPEELSGGQAQRVAVARVLAQRPGLVLADEPTGKLDRATGRRVLDVLLAAVDDLGSALVVTTHDPTVSGRLQHRWSMHEGRLNHQPELQQHPALGPGPDSTPAAAGGTR